MNSFPVGASAMANFFNEDFLKVLPLFREQRRPGTRGHLWVVIFRSRSVYTQNNQNFQARATKLGSTPNLGLLEFVRHKHNENSI